MDDEWITTLQAAKLSGYHPEYLRELIRTKKIYGRKFGVVWQINKQSFIAYLSASKESTDKRRGPKI